MFAVYKKELYTYFINPVGYVYTGVFLAVSALICSMTTLQKASYDTSDYFQYLLFTFIILIPLLTMRSFSEERKTRTEQLLMTTPISITGMVLGKYFAAFTLFVSTILVSCINFFPLVSYAIEQKSQSNAAGTHIGPVGAEIVGCLIGVILIGAAFIAIGLFVSSLTESQLSASVVTVAVIAFMLLVSAVNEYIRKGICDEETKAKIDRKHRTSRFKFETIPVYHNGLPMVIEDGTEYYTYGAKK